MTAFAVMPYQYCLFIFFEGRLASLPCETQFFEEKPLTQWISSCPSTIALNRSNDISIKLNQRAHIQCGTLKPNLHVQQVTNQKISPAFHKGVKGAGAHVPFGNVRIQSQCMYRSSLSQRMDTAIYLAPTSHLIQNIQINALYHNKPLGREGENFTVFQFFSRTTQTRDTRDCPVYYLRNDIVLLSRERSYVPVELFYALSLH